MKKKNKLLSLGLLLLLLFSSCAPRRIEYLQARRELILKDGEKKQVDFNPDDIYKFEDMDSYLSWYENLDKPANLVFKDKEEKKPLTKDEMVEDFDYFFRQIKENYPFFGVLKRQAGIDFLNKYPTYLNEIKYCKDDEEFIKTMEKIIGDLQNDHVSLADRDYVKESLNYYSKFFKDPSMYYEFLAMNQEKVRDRYNINGVQSSRDLDGVRKKKSKSIINENISCENLGDGLGVIRIKQMLAEYELSRDMKILDDFLEKNKDLKAIIIDIRDNAGGNSEYWQKYLLPRLMRKNESLTNHMFFKDGMRSKLLLESEEVGVKGIEDVNIEKMNLNYKEDLKHFSYYSKDPIEISPKDDKNFEGDLYLLVNEGVYSSAEGLASFCKNTNTATLVGKKTGGDGITLGVINDVMPNSGLVFTYTNTLGYAPDGTINEEAKTDVDIIAESFDEAVAIIKQREEIN